VTLRGCQEAGIAGAQHLRECRLGEAHQEEPAGQRAWQEMGEIFLADRPPFLTGHLEEERVFREVPSDHPAANGLRDDVGSTSTGGNPCDRILRQAARVIDRKRRHRTSMLAQADSRRQPARVSRDQAPRESLDSRFARGEAGSRAPRGRPVGADGREGDAGEWHGARIP